MNEQLNQTIAMALLASSVTSIKVASPKPA